MISGEGFAAGGSCLGADSVVEISCERLSFSAFDFSASRSSFS